MADRVCRDGEATTWERRDTPAAAKAYYLRVIQPLSGAGVRSNREMSTLCSALDHLAQGRPSYAADILTMRLKSVEMASRDGNWDRAQYLELVEQDNLPLTSMEEEYMVNKELELQRKLKGRGKGPSFASSSWHYDGDMQQLGKETGAGTCE